MKKLLLGLLMMLSLTVQAQKKCDVCPKEQNLSVKNIVKDKEIKIIGYYDLLGRRVDYMEENKVYIIMYNNGKRQKVVKTR